MIKQILAMHKRLDVQYDEIERLRKIADRQRRELRQAYEEIERLQRQPESAVKYRFGLWDSWL